MTYADRLACLRGEMNARGLDALIVPRADEYLGEYIAEHNERLRWMSGFTGSAGVAIVFADRAAIFVDGRYTVQVKKQVPAELFEILHLIENPHLAWLAEQLKQGSRVGYDPRCHPYNWQQEAENTMNKAGLELAAQDLNLVDECWEDRPQAAAQPAILLPASLTGRTSVDKRAAIAAVVTEKGADAALIFAADSLAWLLNIRGQDVPCLPVVLGFGLLHSGGRLQFFTDPAKIPEDFDAHVGEGVEVFPESAAEQAFAAMVGKIVLADPATANAWCQLGLKRAGVELLAADDPVMVPKACKNPREIDGMREAHVRDGLAVVRFLAWLDREVDAGRLHSEGKLSDRLFAFRSHGEHFRGPSFDTISAGAGNAAMCHYNHLNFDAVSSLEMDSVYLVDSGGQYMDGTTDITRTVAIGDPGNEIRRRFTLVLKGHIALDRAVFPEGTNGTQLDVLARQFLWKEGLDYDHGTGHGVGSFLSVHEGPQRIAKQFNGHALQAGMVISNEPGFYKDDSYGIRCENLVVVREAQQNHEDGPAMFRFESLTVAPFDIRLVVTSLLNQEETAWINDYHTRVRELLLPLLDGQDRSWLEQATGAIIQ
jgi:Xaa-Pro aminopeptidase